ncbi:amidohydrolase [Sinirhodobacter ferrireducens]|uniref:Amidohydrolase n=1 Tax=Paenirhodobacter ferrireducens TaxID=1215032 RepID=A0A443LM17_9RHOB|nr:amidohydrolase family protein [Sinirhodobacter ferrireducens]RWR50193.1 amidohydrolase [Sinirhodobacter ferrireducens]
MIAPSTIRAIDIHVHAEEPCGCHADDGYDALQAEMARYFHAPWTHPPTLHETAAAYREKNIAAVVFPVDAERETGYRRYQNEEVAQAASDHADILIPFGSIDPARGKAGAREARRLVEDFGIRGFKFHPTMQGFFPNDRAAYPLYEAIEAAGVPALFHTGQTGVGAGMRGGNGMRLKYSNPMFLDDVAADFPDLQIIAAHPSFPWQEEALAMAVHKPNVWIDLSGWRPKYFPPVLIQYANTLLQDRVLFGSDWPMIAPEGWLAEFDALPIRDAVRPKILKDNAARLLGLKETP